MSNIFYDNINMLSDSCAKRQISTKKCIKTQNFKKSKIDINHLQDLKNIRKTIFNGSGTNFAQNRILKKKKLPNVPKNTEIPDFLDFKNP